MPNSDNSQYEKTLRENIDFNDNLLRTIPFKMDIVNKNGDILFTNKILEDITGNIIGKKCWDIYRDNKQQCTDCPLLSKIDIGKTKKIISNGVYKGKIYEISHTGIIFNGEEAVLEIFQDITERTQSENRLSRAEIISKTGNWELHVDKNIIVASDGAKKIYDINTESNEIEIQFVQGLALNEYRKLLDDSLKDLIEFNMHYDIEFKIRTIADEIKTIHSIASYDNKNKIVFGIIQDITEQKQNEEALEKSNAVKSVFLSNISHELRTPMNAIIGFSDILLANNKNKDIDRFLRSINSNSKHLDELLNNILDYSKIESDSLDILYEQFSIFDLFDELQDIFGDINYRQNLSFVKLLFTKKKDCIITSDYLRVKQVLHNIISNSIKFTEKGYIKISFIYDSNFLTFKIEDTGIGIDENKIKYVFDRFWQCDSGSRKKYKGTGLGLSISKSIVEILNGDIWLESVLDKGTTFYVRLPLYEVQKKEVKKKELSFSGKTILIIDDIPVIYSLLGIYLNSLHINIISANGGSDAVEIYNKQRDKIDLIIIDLNLFDTKSIKIIKKLKTLCDDCIIISKSGVEEKKNDLVNYHLIKPIKKDVLISLLNKIWQR